MRCRNPLPGGWGHPVIVQATGLHDGSHTLKQPVIFLLNLCGAFLLALLFLELAAHMTICGWWSYVDGRQGRLHLGEIINLFRNSSPQQDHKGQLDFYIKMSCCHAYPISISDNSNWHNN
jgi:hypothetical protein